MELILKAKDIRVEFKGRDVLDIEELEIYDYDRIGLVGANGAGKSTLLRVLLGEIEIEANSEEEARKIAIQMDENGELYDLAGGEECEGCDFDIESVEEDE